jgi:hypothetical protein
MSVFLLAVLRFLKIFLLTKSKKIQGLDNLVNLKELNLKNNPVASKYRYDDPETVKEIEKLRQRVVCYN